MGKLETACLNVRGLQDENKRKRIFQRFCNSKFDIILLKERHSTDEDVVLLKKDWIGCTSFHRSVAPKVEKQYFARNPKTLVEFENSDKAGRIISVTVETQKNKFYMW